MSTDVGSFTDQRNDLLESIERDHQVVRQAMQDLSGAAGSKLNFVDSIHRYPLTWAIGALLVGVWLGSRRAPSCPGL